MGVVIIGGPGACSPRNLQFYETAGLDAIINNVTGSEKRDYFVLFPNFHFKTLISLEP